MRCINCLKLHVFYSFTIKNLLKFYSLRHNDGKLCFVDQTPSFNMADEKKQKKKHGQDLTALCELTVTFILSMYTARIRGTVSLWGTYMENSKGHGGTSYNHIYSELLTFCTHSCCDLFCCGYYNLSWFVLFIYPYPSGLLHWHWGNHMIAPVPVK